MEHRPIEELEVFQLFDEVAGWVWSQVKNWGTFDRDTIGDQLVRATDSINANPVEGDGRFSVADGLRFFVISRASARETRLWLRRSDARGLVPTEEAQAQLDKLTQATKEPNGLINYRRRKGNDGMVREERSLYRVEDCFDPFAEE